MHARISGPKISYISCVSVDDDGIICDTLDTIIKRHEADYTRLYVELDELTLNQNGQSTWHHTARWVSTT